MPHDVVAYIIGDVSHLAIAGGAITLCGIGCIKWFRRRFFMPNQVSCDECLDRYKERDRSLDR